MSLQTTILNDGVANAAERGVGEAFGHSLGGLGTELARAGTHGLVGGGLNMIQGGDFWQGFGVSSISSLAGSGMQAMGWGGNYLPLVTGAFGSGTAWATGGDPLGGFWQDYSIGALNHTGGGATPDDPYQLDEVEIWGYAPFRQKYGQRVYGIWNETVFPMNKAKTYGPSINWGGPWELELSLKIARYFRRARNMEEPLHSEPYIFYTENVHPTIITEDYGPYSIFENKHLVLYESDHHRQTIMRTKGTYRVGDTINYYKKQYWSNGKIDSVSIIRK